MTTTRKILYTAYRRTTGLTDVTITIKDAADSVVVNSGAVTELSNGDYIYNYTPVTAGEHTWYANSASKNAPLSGSFLSDYTSSVTVTTATGALANTQELAQFMAMEGVVPDRNERGEARVRETVGTGDNSKTGFYLDFAGVIDDTYTMAQGTAESGASDLTETTHYTIDIDAGKITLTSAGVTAVATRDIFASYGYFHGSHGIVLTDTQLQAALDRAQSEVERRTNNRWADGTQATPDYAQVTKEKHIGKGKLDRDYYLENFPLPDVSSTLDGDLTASGTTIPVASTDGFLSSGVLGLGTEKITYTGKTSTTFTGIVRGVDDSTAAAGSDGDTMYPFVFELSTTEPGSTPTWEILARDTEYDLDLDTGKLHLFRDDIVLDVLTQSSPPRLVPNRLRNTYVWGNSSIPNDIKRCVLMIAAKDLMHTAMRKANIDGIEHGQKVVELFDVDEKWIENTLNEYRNIQISNT